MTRGRRKEGRRPRAVVALTGPLRKPRIGAVRGKTPMAVAAISLLLAACAPRAQSGEAPLTGSVVVYGRAPGGAPLRGALYLPAGAGPFPVLLYAHGSAPEALSNEAFEAVAPRFTRRGWAVFAPYRRGQGLSRDAGPSIGDEIEAARQAGGLERAQARLARLLATDHMDDQSQAFAWLSRQPFADRRRIAAMGNCFGGVIALLSAERLAVCGAVDAAGAAESWARSPALRALMTQAATRARAPVLFIQAETTSTSRRAASSTPPCDGRGNRPSSASTRPSARPPETATPSPIGAPRSGRTTSMPSWPGPARFIGPRYVPRFAASLPQSVARPSEAPLESPPSASISLKCDNLFVRP